MNKIIKIEWERANIIISFQNKIKGDIYLIFKNNKIKINKINDNTIKFNITNAFSGNMLDRGKYQFLIDEKIAILDESIINNLDDLSRIFPYRNGFYATTVTFLIGNIQELFINIDYMMQNRHYKKYLQLNEKKGLAGKSFILLKKIAFFLINVYYCFFHLFKKKKHVLFLTENSECLSPNLKVLYDSLSEESYKIKTFTHNNFNRKNIALNYLKEVYLIAISSTIIVDNYTPIFNIINVRSKIIQLWHAGVGFKAVGYARYGKDGSPNPYHSGHRQYDVAFVDDESLIPIYEEVFGISPNHFQVSGLPRLENYLDEKIMQEKISNLESINPEFKTKKVILFAPTYRGENQETAYYDYKQIDLKQIYEFCQKNNFIFIVKMHGFIQESITIPKKFQQIIYDYSDLEINDLIYVSDIMITDYSSCAYEYSLFNRPLIFYRYDKINYEYSRPIHTLDVFTEKQIEVRTMDELISALNKYKNIAKKDRFSAIKMRKNTRSCDIIKKEIV